MHVILQITYLLNYVGGKRKNIYPFQCDSVTIAAVTLMRREEMADHGVVAGGSASGMWNLPRTEISNDTKNLLQSTSRLLLLLIIVEGVRSVPPLR